MNASGRYLVWRHDRWYPSGAKADFLGRADNWRDVTDRHSFDPTSQWIEVYDIETGEWTQPLGDRCS